MKVAMKIMVTSIGLSLLISACSNKQIVRKFVRAQNAYDFNRVATLVAGQYKEYLWDGSLEISDTSQLRSFLEWRATMTSTIVIKKMQTLDKSRVKTTETNQSYLDKALGLKPRTFAITYLFEEDELLYATIDTLEGNAQITAYNQTKIKHFRNFCTKHQMRISFAMNAQEARQLRKALATYQKAH